MMEIKKTITRTYVVSSAIRKPFMKFGTFRKVRETHQLRVEKTCFCCGHRFKDDEDIFIVFFKNTHNRLFCHKCNECALKEVEEKKE